MVNQTVQQSGWPATHDICHEDDALPSLAGPGFFGFLHTLLTHNRASIDQNRIRLSIKCLTLIAYHHRCRCRDSCRSCGGRLCWRITWGKYRVSMQHTTGSMATIQTTSHGVLFGNNVSTEEDLGCLPIKAPLTVGPSPSGQLLVQLSGLRWAHQLAHPRVQQWDSPVAHQSKHDDNAPTSADVQSPTGSGFHD